MIRVQYLCFLVWIEEWYRRGVYAVTTAGILVNVYGINLSKLCYNLHSYLLLNTLKTNKYTDKNQTVFNWFLHASTKFCHHVRVIRLLQVKVTIIAECVLINVHLFVQKDT
jgi:hypothetical protein